MWTPCLTHSFATAGWYAYGSRLTARSCCRMSVLHGRVVVRVDRHGAAVRVALDQFLRLADSVRLATVTARPCSSRYSTCAPATMPAPKTTTFFIDVLQGRKARD